MAVLRLRRIELENILRESFQTHVQLVPIGNHSLRRHLVYRLMMDQKVYVFKYYYQSAYRNKEVSALKLCEELNIKIPKLVDYGYILGNREWIMVEHLEGVPLFKVLNLMSLENRLAIFKEMGDILGRMHSRAFSCYGQLDEDLSPMDCFSDAKTIFLHEAEHGLKRLDNKGIPNKAILLRAYRLLMENADLFSTCPTPVLCHLDFDARNVLVKRFGCEWRIQGILDFEHSMPYDPAADFAGLVQKHFAKSPELEVAFMQGYKQHRHLDAHFNERLELHVLFQCLKVCIWAYKTAEDYYNESLELLKRVIQSMEGNYGETEAE